MYKVTGHQIIIVGFLRKSWTQIFITSLWSISQRFTRLSYRELLLNRCCLCMFLIAEWVLKPHNRWCIIINLFLIRKISHHDCTTKSIFRPCYSNKCSMSEEEENIEIEVYFIERMISYCASVTSYLVKSTWEEI